MTGNPAVTGFTAPKILWVRDNEPDVYARAKQVLLPKDYIRYKLTDTYATDSGGRGWHIAVECGGAGLVGRNAGRA